jgi:hypothetical protein
MNILRVYPWKIYLYDEGPVMPEAFYRGRNTITLL